MPLEPILSASTRALFLRKKTLLSDHANGATSARIWGYRPWEVCAVRCPDLHCPHSSTPLRRSRCSLSPRVPVSTPHYSSASTTTSSCSGNTTHAGKWRRNCATPQNPVHSRASARRAWRFRSRCFGCSHRCCARAKLKSSLCTWQNSGRRCSSGHSTEQWRGAGLRQKSNWRDQLSALAFFLRRFWEHRREPGYGGTATPPAEFRQLLGAAVDRRVVHKERVRRRRETELEELARASPPSVYAPSTPDLAYREAARDSYIWGAEVERTVIQYVRIQRSRTQLDDPGW